MVASMQMCIRDSHHAGAVIRNAGNDVYYVGSRGTWYPRSGGDLARYDLTFRYPKTLTIAATGKVLEDGADGDWRVTQMCIRDSLRTLPKKLALKPVRW